MVSEGRLLFNYCSFRQPNGTRVSILPDYIYKMEDAEASNEILEPDPVEGDPGRTKVKEVQKFRCTIIVNPFGDKTVVLDTQEQITEQIQRASLDAVTTLGQRVQKQIVQAPAGVVLNPSGNEVPRSQRKGHH